MWRFPERLRGRRALWVVAGASLGLWALRGGGAAGEFEPLRTRRADLLQEVELEGELESTRAARLGPPEAEGYEFKLSFLAPEGRSVRRGEPVLGFDTLELQRQLDTQRAELAEAEARLERQGLDLEARLADLEQERSKAATELARARLKVDVPAELVARLELEQARLEAEGKSRELRAAEARLAAARSTGRAESGSLRARLDRTRARCAELARALAAMTVRAPQDGLVLYVADWRDQKKQVGDTVWARETVVELPDLEALQAVGQVDEADAGRLAPGQRARLRLEAAGQVELAARVSSIGRVVQRQSWRTPRKVYRVVLGLEGPRHPGLRPAMRFRGLLEVARVPGVLLAPRAALFLRAHGPVAFVRRLGRWRETAVRVGRGNAREVEIVAGLDEGARLAPYDLALDRAPAPPAATGPRP